MTRDSHRRSLLQRELRKKTDPQSWDEGHSLEAFHHRLRDLCRHDGAGDGSDRAARAAHEAEQACALARELEILRQAGQTFEEFRNSDTGLRCGTEHLVEFDDEAGRVIKITVPPKFGLIPAVTSVAQVNLRDDPAIPPFRNELGIVHATPLEYLERWLASNEVFEDDVHLTSVIEWSDGQISFAISQPQYHGEPAADRDIESYFTEAGWTRIPDATGHLLFFNYAFNVLAIDALPRNCYISDGQLQPFDVILCHPEEGLEGFLRLYP